MAQLDPRVVQMMPTPITPSRYELKLHEIAPEDIEPNGDRYVIEVVDIDEKVQLGTLLVVTQVPEKKDPNNPMADPQVEQRGVLAGIIVSGGSGHLLGLPDHKLVVGDDIMVSPSDVPMFYQPGQVVLFDRNAKGRALKILGRECRIVNQIDILASIKGLRLTHTEHGWERE